MAIQKIKIFSVFFAFYLGACQVIAAENNPPQAYSLWLQELKEDMAERGISQKTLNEAFAKNYYSSAHNVIKQDRKQNEFVLTASPYLARVLAPQRVKEGRRLYQKLKKKYPQGVDNVPLSYLVAFWGIETNYGTYKGGYNAIEALTMLSYDQRRPKFFRNELYYALKIIDSGHVEVNDMESSWAGAMGHFQFMPTTFDAYGKDADNDGKIDIWNNFSDAIFSAAAYLSDLGWKQNEPWGVPVQLSWNFDYKNSGRKIKKSVKNWKKLGVQVNGIDDCLVGALLVPEGRRGQAYLVFDNFSFIMQWNKSENYALAVGLLSDAIKKTGKIVNKKVQSPIYPLSSAEVKYVQEFINQQGIADIVADGYLGTQTREAVQKLQRRFKLPADGYPDYLLLQKVARFQEYGYYLSVPPQRLHRAK